MIMDLEITAYPARNDRGAAGPTMLVLPGGGYGRLADHETEPVARWLNSLGLNAAVLRYRVAPHRHPAPLEDASAAMNLIRSGEVGFPVDPGQVGVIGFSAGGHLAASLSTTEDDAVRPDFAVLCYPVISFVHDVEEGSVANLLGPRPGLAARRRHSMEYRVTARTPPTFLWHTADDPGVAVSNSLRYTDALTRHGVPAELHVFPHGRHGLSILNEVPHVQQWMGLCGNWLQSLG